MEHQTPTATASNSLEALVIEPEKLPHNQTFIVLHGRGSTAEKFGPTLLEHPIETSGGIETIRDLFPHVRFVFPTAPLTRATLYKRSLTHQWFDRWKHYRPNDPEYGERDDLQIAGLRATTELLHGLICKEAEAISGAQNIVLWGLSQGCAASAIALLLWEGPALGAFVGMCGYLPWEALLAKESSTTPSVSVDDEDPFETSTNDESPILQLREMLDVSPTQASQEFKNTPIFFGHGTLDDKVFVEEGHNAATRFEELGAEEVVWKEYAGLGHWYSSHMLRDASAFLKAILD